jgi:hypothetical protein
LTCKPALQVIFLYPGGKFQDIYTGATINYYNIMTYFHSNMTNIIYLVESMFKYFPKEVVAITRI